MTIVVTILVIVLIIYFLLGGKKDSQQPTTPSTTTGAFKSSPTKTKKPFPDRWNDITFHRMHLEELLQKGDFESANVTFAKLIESLRQQNENLDGGFRHDYENAVQEYENFLTKHKLEKPEQFLDPTKPKPKKKFNSSDFFGTKTHSPNFKFSVAYQDSFEEGKKGDVYLLQTSEVLFHKKIERPNSCVVSNDGIVAVCDWTHTDELAGRFLIFDSGGKQIVKIETTANLGNCSISDDSKFAIFETYRSDTDDSEKIFVVDIEQKKVTGKFEHEFSFKSAKINSESKVIEFLINGRLSYEVDFYGEWINKDKFEKHLIEKGSKTDKVEYLEILYKDREDELFKNDIYLQALMDNIKNENFKDGLILKKIGEIYEFRDDTESAIKFYQQALEKNDRIGVKTKLTKLQKKSS